MNDESQEPGGGEIRQPSADSELSQVPPDDSAAAAFEVLRDVFHRHTLALKSQCGFLVPTQGCGKTKHNRRNTRFMFPSHILVLQCCRFSNAPASLHEAGQKQSPNARQQERRAERCRGAMRHLHFDSIAQRFGR